MHYIYCYTNKINNHRYVGQTNNIQRRKKEHRSNSFNPMSAEYDLLFHKKIRQYGEDNFIFSVLEEIDTDNVKEVNEREIYWINQMGSYVENGGYNLTLGGDNMEHNRIYSVELIPKIKEEIKSGQTYQSINERYGISIGYISGINSGYYFHDDSETYPLYKYYSSQEEVDQIVDMLVNTEYTLKEIADKTGRSYSTIKKINSGALYPDLSKTYPIRKVSAGKQKALKVQQMLLEGKTNEEIIRELGVSRQTISRINNGETHHDPSLTYPLR